MKTSFTEYTANEVLKSDGTKPPILKLKDETKLRLVYNAITIEPIFNEDERLINLKVHYWFGNNLLCTLDIEHLDTIKPGYNFNLTNHEGFHTVYFQVT